jgi:hypothetical protein
MNPDLFSLNDPAVDVNAPPDHELFADVNFDGGALTSWQFPFPTGEDDLARPVHQNGLPLEPLTPKPGGHLCLQSKKILGPERTTFHINKVP